MTIKLTKSTTTPHLVKSIFRNSKMWGIYTEIQEVDEFIKFTSTGPEELIGHQTKYGRLLYALFYSVTSNLASITETNQSLDVHLEFISRDSVFDILLPMAKIPSLFPLDQVFQDKLISPFDSKIEHQFAKKFTQLMDGWELQSEIVLIQDNSVFIPDFLLRYRHIEVIVEIVGFWTQAYLQKKAKKLEFFSKYYENIVILVDEKLDFPNLQEKGISSFRYGRKMNINQFIEYIRTNYEKQAFIKHCEKLYKDKDLVIENINSKLVKDLYIDEQQLLELLQAKSASEISRILKFLFTNTEFDDFVVFPFYKTIISNEFLKRTERRLKKLVPKNGLSKDKIGEELKLDEKMMIILLSFLGYTEKYSSLADILIFPPI